MFGAGWLGHEIRSADRNDGLIVLGIHQKCESGGVRLQHSASSNGQQRPTQATPMKSPVHGKSPDANRGRGTLATEIV
jgi:hypothetical protein